MPRPAAADAITSPQVGSDMSQRGQKSSLTLNSPLLTLRACRGGSHNQVKQVLNSRKFILQSKSFRTLTTLANHRFNDVRGNEYCTTDLGIRKL